MSGSPIEPGVIASTESFIRRFCILPDAAYLPLALWAVATHLPDAFDAFPYIALLSPAKRCGKTRVFEVLELLTSKAWHGTSATSAALFRMMEDVPTLLLDEVEALGNSKPSESAQAVLAVLNAGHRKGATIPRCDGPEHKVRHFPVYGPKAFAAIGTLPDTLADRCIHVTMQRKTPSQTVDRFLQGRAKDDAEPVRESLVEWAKAYQESVRCAYENMADLKFLSDRDLWMPLFAVCTVAEPERLDELQRCAVALSGAKAAGDVEDSLPLKLLADVKDSFQMLAAGSVDEQIDCGHGRVETRRCSVLADLSLIDNTENWASLRAVVRIQATRFHKATGKQEHETRYYITSLKPDAQRLNAAIRQHWGIENKLHWVLDVTFGEDQSRKRAGNAAQNFSLLNRIALNLIRKDKSSKGSIRGKRLQAAWDDDFLWQLLAEEKS